MTPKQYYTNYLADDGISDLSLKMFDLIKQENPDHIFEFGMGTGKNLRMFSECTAGLDISFINCIVSKARNSIPMIIVGDETNLRHLCNFDIVFTMSVLDHIEDIDGIIGEFKRIANKAIYLAETNDVPGDFYYPHDYESYGFTNVGFTWKSSSDGATYQIWKYKVCVESQE